MALRIARHVVSGLIDNRVEGRVTGFLELAGGLGRVALDLTGNGHPDIAGSLVGFRNPSPEVPPADAVIRRMAAQQAGTAGDITASRKVRQLLVPPEAFEALDEAARKSACRLANSVYFEWFSDSDGRVVLEGINFVIEVIEGPMWKLPDKGVGARAKAAFNDDEEIRPAAEKEMDVEMARMDLLTNRIARRLEKDGRDEVDWERIYEEESARLRRERGEPEPEPLTPDEIEERELWIQEMNAAAAEALREMEADAWKGEPEERRNHPLVEECRALALELDRSEHIPPSLSQEHPLAEIRDGVFIASGKLAGALNRMADEDEWPPTEWFAPSVLVFLKKARGHLRDALLGMDAADQENLTDPGWRRGAKRRITRILLETQRLIEEARGVLGEGGG